MNRKIIVFFKKPLIRFLIKFIGLFICFYSINVLIISLSAYGGIYSEFVHNNLDYISYCRKLLVYNSKSLLQFFNIETYLYEPYYLKKIGGRGVIIGYDCVGYGIICFWVAFLIAGKSNFLNKIIWITVGSITFWILNVSRISLVLVATNENWIVPFKLDHHTFYNIVVYTVFLILIFLYEKKQKKLLQ